MKSKTSNSTNLKRGNFKKEELQLYGLENSEIDIILQYQKLLPILQQDNENKISARELWIQLGEPQGEFSKWVDRKIIKKGFKEGRDYKLETTKLSNQVKVSHGGDRRSQEYILTVETAKHVAMMENTLIGRTSREYFIYIEKAFKGRYEWNLDREETLIKCKALKRALIRYDKQVASNIPKYFNNNKFIAEFCLLNEVIIGMTASEYRRRKGFDKNYPIRNSFTEKELEYVHILEQYDADLIEVQNIFGYEDRKEYLDKKFKLLLM